MRCAIPLVIVALAGCAGPPVGDGFASLSAALRSRPVALLGEVHDSAGQHALRARALRGLVEAGARPALLMEQFDRERQADLDRAMAAPGATADAVIAAAGGDGWEWPLYRPYVALALDYRLPLVAANVSRADARLAMRDGLIALGFDPQVPPDIAAAQAQAIVAGHCGLVDEAQAAVLVSAQVARDQFMARGIEAHARRGAVLLAGNGHVRADIGVPRWLSAATRARSVAIGVLEGKAPDSAAYDAVVVTAPQSRPDPCEGMRQDSKNSTAPSSRS